MAERQNPLILVRPSHLDFIKPEGGGGPRKIFGVVNRAARRHLQRQVEASQSYFRNQLRQNSNLRGVLKIILKSEALAKSHRPIGLLEANNCPVIGVGKLGELFASVNDESFSRLEKQIVSGTTKIIEANVSTIQEIVPYGPDDVMGSGGYKWLKNEIDRGHAVLKFKLFPHHNPVHDAAAYDFFEKLLQQLKLGKPEPVKYGKMMQLYTVQIKNPDFLRPLSNCLSLKSLSTFPKFTSLKPQAVTVRQIQKEDIPEPSQGIEYPLVGIVDSGINPNELLLKQWVTKRHNFIPPGSLRDYEHGSFIGGLVVNARRFNHEDSIFPLAISKIVDVAAFAADEDLNENELLAILDEVIPQNPTVKVWNLSMNLKMPCQPNNFSDLAIALDELQDRYDVTFVISSGNYENLPLRGWPPENLGDEDCVAPPGDSVRALTVGSLAHKEVKNSRVGIGKPSPFSRKGPGPVFIPKPELTHYGGNCDAKGRYIQTGILSINGKGEIAEGIGTSYATPIISTLLANVKAGLGGYASRNLAKALLIHSAAIRMNDLTTEELRFYGFGVPSSLSDIFACANWQATSIFNLELIPNIEFVKEFPIPDSLKSEDGKVRGDFTITLVYDPPLDPSFGSEYCRANVEVSLGTHTQGANGKFEHHKKIPLNPLDISEMFEGNLIEHGFKWSPVKVYKRVIPRGINGENWRLRVSVHHRSLFKTNSPQSATVIVTIASPEKTGDIYSEFLNKARTLGWITSNIQVDERLRIRT